MDDLREGMPGGGMESLPRFGFARPGPEPLLVEEAAAAGPSLAFSDTDETDVSLDGDLTDRIADGCDESVDDTVGAGDAGI